MNQIKKFRLLVVLSLAVFVGWYFLFFIDIEHEPMVSQILGWSGYGGNKYIQHPGTDIFLAVLKIISSIGLFLLLSWSRYLLLAVVVLGCVIAPFRGISIGLPSDAIWGSLLGLSDGAILALVFYSPIADAFHRDE